MLRKIKTVFKSRYRLLSGIFVVILVFPTVTFPLLKNVLSTERDGLNENRNLSKFEFSLQNFGANFDTFYQDNFPFRNSLIPLYNKYHNILYSKYFNKNLRDDVDEPDSIQEFEKEEVNITEEPVKYDFTDAEFDKFHKLIKALTDADNYFTSLNKKIIFQVCPKKDKITDQTANTAELDYITSYLDQNTSVNFSFPIDRYLALEPDYRPYDEYNSHHNFLGAYVSWQEIQRDAGFAITDISEIDITEFEIDVRKIITTPYNIKCCYPYNQDLLPASRKTLYITSINYNVRYKPEIKIETIHNSGCYRLEFKSDNKNGQTLFITGDSFLETQLQYAVKDFEFSNVSHLYNLNTGSRDRTYRSHIKNYIKSADVIVIVQGENTLWKDDIEHNPGLEYRIAFLLELAKEIY